MSIRHIIPISGKDSLACAIVQMEREPSLPYEFIFSDTSMELPDTYQWLDHVEDRLGIKIHRIGKSLEQVIEEQGMMPSGNRRFCTKYSKIYPIRDFLKDSEAVQYVGIRHDEDHRRDLRGSDNVEFRFPLVDAGVAINDVYRILGERDLLPPDFHWKRMWDAVSSLGVCLDRANETHRRLTAWRTRTNCYMCFYQRRYEWVGLLEHYPKLFDRAEAIEQEYGTAGTRGLQKDFHWINGLPLQDVRVKADLIFRRRSKEVAKQINDSRQGRLFVIQDLLSTTTCGIYCGK